MLGVRVVSSDPKRSTRRSPRPDAWVPVVKKVATVDVYEIPGHGLVLVDLSSIPDTPWQWCIMPTTSGGWVFQKFFDTADIERYGKIDMLKAAVKVARAVDAKKGRR